MYLPIPVYDANDIIVIFYLLQFEQILYTGLQFQML